MKIIFLDIDGVLNDLRDLSFLDKSIDNLNKIIEETHADIVISSSWRLTFSFDELLEILQNAGIKGNIIGKTPFLLGEPRANEIYKWIINKWTENDNKVRNFVILDDSDIFKIYYGEEDFVSNDELLKRFVRTSPYVGLTKENAEEAIRIINNEIR